MRLTKILKQILKEEVYTVDQIVNRYIQDTNYDIKNSLGNCSFFTKDIINWGKKNGIQIDYLYMPQDESYRKKHSISDNEWEDHIVPMYNNTIIDFTLTPQGVSKEVRKKNTIPPILNKYSPSLFKPNGDYGKWGYYKPEVNTQYGEKKSIDTMPTVNPKKK